MQVKEMKETLSKKFLEVCREGILLTYGKAHTLYDNTLSGTVAANAKEKICRGQVSSSDIIGVLDTSFSGKGKSGFAFTHEAIYCSCIENADSNFMIKYEDIDFVFYEDSGDPYLKIYRKNSNNFYKINLEAFSKKKIMWFLDFAQELYDEENNIELDWDKL